MTAQGMPNSQIESLTSTDEVDMLPAVRCNCGKPTGFYHERLIDWLREGGSAEQFFDDNGLRRVCCRTTLMIAIPFSKGREYYNLDAISGRVSLASVRSTLVLPDTLGSIMSKAPTSSTRTTLTPVPDMTVFGPTSISVPAPPMLVERSTELSTIGESPAVTVSPGTMQGGGYIGKPPEGLSGYVISEQHMEPMRYVGKRVIPFPGDEKGKMSMSGGVPKSVAVLKSTLGTDPLSNSRKKQRQFIIRPAISRQAASESNEISESQNQTQ